MGAFNELNNSILGNPDWIPENERLTRLSTFGSVVSIIVNLILGIAFSISIIGLAYSFVQMAISQGDKIGLTKAKTAAVASTIALIVVILAVALKNTIFGAIGVTSTTSAPTI